MDNNSTKYSIETLNLDPEVKAHIYQQILEFEPYLLPGTQISVLIENQNKSKGKTGNRVVVTFSLLVGGAQISGKGKAPDVYEAVKLAKKDILNQLDMIQSQFVSYHDREQTVSQILAHKSLFTLH